MSHSKPRNAPSGPGSASGSGLRIVPLRREGKLTLTIERRDITAPSRAFFADYIDVTNTSNDVSMMFGKLRPKMFWPDKEKPQLRYVIEVSFPHAPFCEQFDELIRTSQEGQQTFLEAVTLSVGSRATANKVADPTPDLPANGQEFGGLRANTAYLYLQDDEACIDFFYLDAATMHSMRAGSGPAPIPGLLRILLTPAVLFSFLRRSADVAKEIRSNQNQASA